MDFDSKILQFKKKALWKQLEGYKKVLFQRELELNQCQQKNEEAGRVVKAINLALSKIINLIPHFENTKTVHESLVPFKDFISNSITEKNLSQNFISILEILSQNFATYNGKIIIQTSQSSSEIQKDLQILELKSNLNSEIEKSYVLENKIFSLEKKVSMLQLDQNEKNLPESLLKRPRVDQDEDNIINVNGMGQELSCKINVINIELEELKKVSGARVAELESFFLENKKLKEELEYKRDQIRKIPQEFLRDGASFHQLNDDLKRCKNDINDAVLTIKSLERESIESNYRNKKIITQLEQDLKEKYTRLEDFVKTTDLEIGRLRNDRDLMRKMYEETNTLLSSCQKQLNSYQKSLNYSESAINQLTGTVQKLKSHLSLIPALSSDTTELNIAIENLRADEQVYLEELENLGKSFEQLQTENYSLIKKLADKDEQLTKFLGDKLKAEFSLSQIQKEAESSMVRAQKIEEISKHRVSEAEAREDSLRRQMSLIDKNISEQIVLLNGYKSRLNEATAENTSLRNKIEKYVTAISELKSQIPASSAKDQFLFENRRLEEELSIANKKIEVYSASGIGIIKDLEDELGNYKKLMKCNSCHIRDKNAVILKCMHCFCKTCLDVRLETRQRKCPNCGDAFGASDVKQIFFCFIGPLFVGQLTMSHLFAANRRNVEYHELFKNIPQEELLIDSYSCALSREILIHGRLYLSANFACFNANILGWVTNIVVNLNDLISIEKKMTALIIPNGITLSTLHTRHVYASFIKRDEAYNKICKVWKNCIADKPVPTTELLTQIASGKSNFEFADEIANPRRFRERKTSIITDSGVESIMSDNFLFSGDLDPALTVRREYNFGSSRQKGNSINLCNAEIPDAEISEFSNLRCFEIDEAITENLETDEEQKEVRESILPCSCAFHYKNMLLDQLILKPMPSMMEGLLFTKKSSLTSVPRAFQKTLKDLGAREIKFSPWKVYLGKWERRTWCCELPARKLLLHDAFLTVKVTDSVIKRQIDKICIESLMQISGIPGGGSFVKWKLCATSPASDSAATDQCRVTITAAAASPLGSWFKDSIRSALLQHVAELWCKAIETAANFEYSEDCSSDLRSLSVSAAKSSDTLSKIIFPHNFQHSLSSVTLTYFDRKAFFLSISRFASGFIVLLLAIFAGNRFLSFKSVSINANVQLKDINRFQKHAHKVQNEYYDFLETNLNIRQKYPENLEQATNEFKVLDVKLTQIVEKVYLIQREVGDQ